MTTTKHEINKIQISTHIIRHGNLVLFEIDPIDFNENLKFNIYLLKYGCGAEFYNISFENADEKYYRYKASKDLITLLAQESDTEMLNGIDDPNYEQIGVATFPNQIESVKEIIFTIEYKNNSLPKSELKIDNPGLPILVYYDNEGNFKLKSKNETKILSRR